VGRVPRPKKALGQHFLTDPRILERIVDALEPAPTDVVVEIGAGTGTLTRVVAARVALVVAIEKDRALAESLRIADGLRNVQVVWEDILRFDWAGINPQSAIPNPHFKIVGNIPYYITTPIIEASLLQRPACLVLLVQEAVADRLVSPPGSKVYGALSVGVQVEAWVEKLFVVKAGSFVPAPAVNSAVIRLRPLEDPLVRAGDVPRFRVYVAACFSRRRKQLGHILRSLTGRNAAVVEGACADLGLDPVARPETLAPDQFVRLWRWSDDGNGG
jgi:16S rRNA (adenine1518-N6/adenine1519-N6)-dimethyltransferase